MPLLCTTCRCKTRSLLVKTAQCSTHSHTCRRRQIGPHWCRKPIHTCRCSCKIRPIGAKPQNKNNVIFQWGIADYNIQLHSQIPPPPPPPLIWAHWNQRVLVTQNLSYLFRRLSCVPGCYLHAVTCHHASQQVWIPDLVWGTSHTGAVLTQKPSLQVVKHMPWCARNITGLRQAGLLMCGFL